MTKIAFIGAGSSVFAKNLMGDIFGFPELATAHIVLHDIDEARLRFSEALGHRVAKLLGVNPQIEATTDRRAALAGAEYVINMIQVGGYKPCTVTDFDIPKKYGLRQTIGDTLGIGGIMRSLRTIPVLLEMVRDMEELCPDALHLNYTNPMAMNSWALNRASKIKTVGLCHSVQGTAGELARDIDVPLEEINYLAAGINHMTFFLRFERDGQSLYPLLHQIIERGQVPAHDLVRYEIFRRLGYFVTESSEHFSEYVPWFIKRDRPDLLEQFNIPLDEYLGRCELNTQAWQFAQENGLLSGNRSSVALLAELEEHLADIEVSTGAKNWTLKMFQELDEVSQSHEYGARIIHSMETGEPRVIYGNVLNHSLIDNLPQDCCVEVPCLVDKNGIQPTRIGKLPSHLAALMRTNINVQELTVEAALTRKREKVYHAAMLDPHTAAELDLDQIWNLVDDLIEAHGDWLPDFE